MPVLSCPHCGSVHIIIGVLVGGKNSPLYRCNCGAIMEQERSSPDASATIRKAFYNTEFPADDEVIVTAEAP